MGEEQAVQLVVDVLGHPAKVGGYHRDPGLQRLVNDQGRVLRPDRGHHDRVAAVEHVGDDVLIPVLSHPLDSAARGSRQTPGQRLQSLGFDSPVPSPDSQTGTARHAAKGLNQVVDPLRRYVRSDVSECERLAPRSVAALHALPVESVVEVREFTVREPEVVPEPAQKVHRGRDEYIDGVAHLPDVSHPPCHPISPVGGVRLVLLLAAREVAHVAANGALPVVLPVAYGPDVRGVGWIHLYELAPGTHQPVVVEREHDRYPPLLRLKHERSREMVQVADVYHLWANVVQQAAKRVVDCSVPVAVTRSRHVDEVNRDAVVGRVGFHLRCVLGKEGVLLPREYVHLVAVGKRLRQALGVDLRARVVPHRIAVDYLEYLHCAAHTADQILIPSAHLAGQAA